MRLIGPGFERSGAWPTVAMKSSGRLASEEVKHTQTQCYRDEADEGRLFP
jgi:hypothetical protein